MMMDGTSYSRQQQIDGHPPLRCWFCERPTPVRAVVDQGILASRELRDGGPYRIFTCPYCLKDWMCEETRLGRWFASPNVKLGFLDYLLARAEASGTEPDSQAVLKAISWLKENEERRRYYFERDGDDRYTGASLLRRLWPWGRADRAPAQEKRSSRPEPGAGGERARESGARQERARNAAADEQEETRRRQRQRSQRAAPPPPPRRPHLLSPHEILGVPPNATPDEIYRQFCRLAVRYHPDKVHHLGAEFQAEAHRRFVALQRAYETLRRHERGGR